MPVADVEIGHRSTTVCHLGNIARWTGRKLQWDPDQEQFVGDAEANQLLFRSQRQGFEIPDNAVAMERHVKIDRIDVFPLRYPMTGFFKFLAGALARSFHFSAGKIKSVPRFKSIRCLGPLSVRTDSTNL